MRRDASAVDSPLLFVAADARPRSTVTRCRRCVRALMTVAIAATTPAIGMEVNQHGLTGSWYNPATSGQGLEIEVYQDLTSPGHGLLQAGWFTFESGGGSGQRWYTLSGPAVTGVSSVAVTIYQNTGGRFNGPPTTAGVVVGTGLLSFSSCTTGSLSYAFTGTYDVGSMPLTRLTKNVACDEVGSTEPVNLDFGLSGNWYQASTSGQGIIVELNNVSNVAFVTWYTYSPAGTAKDAAGQRWLTAQGPYTMGARFITMNLYETTGGHFNAGPLPTSIQVGTAQLSFMTCQLATLQYNFTAGTFAGMSGVIPETRLGATARYCF
jgi:pseudomonalisin